MARSRGVKVPRCWHCGGRLAVAPRHHAIQDRLLLTCPAKDCGAGMAGQVQAVLYPDGQGGWVSDQRPTDVPS